MAVGAPGGSECFWNGPRFAIPIVSPFPRQAPPSVSPRIFLVSVPAPAPRHPNNSTSETPLGYSETPLQPRGALPGLTRTSKAYPASNQCGSTWPLRAPSRPETAAVQYKGQTAISSPSLAKKKHKTPDAWQPSHVFWICFLSIWALRVFALMCAPLLFLQLYLFLVHRWFAFYQHTTGACCMYCQVHKLVLFCGAIHRGRGGRIQKFSNASVGHMCARSITPSKTQSIPLSTHQPHPCHLTMAIQQSCPPPQKKRMLDLDKARLSTGGVGKGLGTRCTDTTS